MGLLGDLVELEGGAVVRASDAGAVTCLGNAAKTEDELPDRLATEDELPPQFPGIPYSGHSLFSLKGTAMGLVILRFWVSAPEPAQGTATGLSRKQSELRARKLIGCHATSCVPIRPL